MWISAFEGILFEVDGALDAEENHVEDETISCGSGRTGGGCVGSTRGRLEGGGAGRSRTFCPTVDLVFGSRDLFCSVLRPGTRRDGSGFDSM